ncbi:MAG: S8 family serine peptidase [Calditrichia bacterium]
MKNICLSFLLILYSFPVWGQTITNFYYHKGQMVRMETALDQMSVRLSPDILPENVNSVIRNLFGASLAEILPLITNHEKLIRLKSALTEINLQEMLNALNNLDAVKMASPVFRYGRVRQITNDEFFVKFRSGISFHEIEQLNAEYGVEILKSLGDGVYQLSVGNGAGLNGLLAANAYFLSGLADWAEPEFIYPNGELLNATVNDALWNEQWAHRNTGQTVATGSNLGPSSVNGSPDADMDVDLAWNITAGGDPDIIVGILDTGTDLDHPDLQANIVAGYDFAENDNVPNDDAIGHGTCTAGIVAAVGDNAIGVSGIAYQCKIMPVRIFNDGGTARNQWIANGINWAWQNGADILSNSWGGGSPSSLIDDAISNAKQNGRGGRGCVILFSSGNDGHDPVNYPAYLSDVIAVGASNMFDEKKNPGSSDQQYWWGGNYGSALDIVAPTIVYTTDIAGSGGYSSDDYIDVFNGTSAACPNAAGVAALVLSVDPNLTSDEVQTIMEESTDRIEKFPYNSSGWNKHVGYGRVNAYKAVLAAQGFDSDYPLMVHSMLHPTSNTAAQIVTVDITDESGIAGGPDQPRLHYRLDHGSGFGPWNSVTDVNGPAGIRYEFLIPGQAHGTQVQYYIQAQDNALQNNIGTLPFGAGNPGAVGSSGIPFTFSVDNFAPQSFSGNRITLYSSAIVSGTINVNISFMISDLNLILNETRARTENLVFCLQSPSGMRSGPFINNGSGSGLTDLILNDEAEAALSSGTNPFSGSYQPDNPLWVFDGENAQGAWTLYIINDASLNSGAITSWTLAFNSEDYPDQGLPVTLTGFSGIFSEGKVMLRWRTESEIENAGYEVWRSEHSEKEYDLIDDHRNNTALLGAGNSTMPHEYQYEDKFVEKEKTYFYKIADISYSGQRTFSKSIKVETNSLLSAGPVPENFELLAPYPNPFNPVTRIRFGVPTNEEKVQLLIFDNLGKKIRTLISGPMSPGYHELIWRGENDSNFPVSSGIYYILYRGGSESFTRKVMLMK